MVAAVGLASAAVGAYGSVKSSQNNKAAAQAAGQLDPRIADIVFGNGTSGNAGLLSRYQDLLNQPQSAASQAWSNTNADYLNKYAGSDMNAVRNSALGLMNGSQAPTSQAAATGPSIAGAAQTSLPAYAVGSQVQAPSQNNIDLTSSYNSLLSGGNTDALKSSLQAGNDLTSAQFQKNQTDVTNNLMRNVLPSIRSNSVLSGQYGGSRQGVAEGNAISDFTKQLNDSNTQIGLANSASTANALAGAYENGQNRALSATQGLGAQQYGVASQNSANEQAAQTLNVNNLYDANKTNAALSQQSILANQNAANTANLANTGYQQQTNLANQQAQLTTNAQNNSAASAGAGLLAGMLGQTGANVTAQDNYAINKASQVNGLLQGYLTGSPTQSNVSSNSTAAGLGGALQGLQFGSQLGGLLGGGQSTQFKGEKMGSLFDLFGGNSSFSGGFGS
jgi:hypothetical protein